VGAVRVCEDRWLLHECRMPGAERMDLPYECPMDHIFEPGRWVNQQMNFRSSRWDLILLSV
jgi:hypothetical protein